MRIILISLFCACSAFGARDYGTTGSSNTGAVSESPTSFTYAGWIYLTDANLGNQHQWITPLTSGVPLGKMIFNNPGEMWAQIAGTGSDMLVKYNTFNVSSGRWEFWCIAWDGTYGANHAVMWWGLQTSSVTNRSESLLAAGSGSPRTITAIYIGHTGGTTGGAKLADVKMYYNQNMSQAQCEQVRQGINPTPGTLAHYYPLWGYGTTEPDRGPNNAPLTTVTNATLADHSPQFLRGAAAINNGN